jgi:tRNA threonylcarbamoyl adenosine modification protein YeaZ
LRILAIDTALGATSAAVYDGETSAVLAEETSAMERGHAEALVPMVARVMEQAGASFSSIDRFAVTTGPGSFTGLRIGISAARAFALAVGKPAVGVSTLAAFAAPELFASEPRAVASAIDARHGMLFFQFMGPDGRMIVPPGLISIAEAVRKLGDARNVFVGDAAEALARAKKETMPDYRITETMIRQRVAPEIAWVARLAVAADPATAPARPLYLREANVTPQDGARVRRVEPTGA